MKRSMTYKIKKTFLTWFGDLKFFKTPPVIVYSPTTFKMKGSHTRQAMNVIQPGDILLRKYYGYVDGLFIPGAYSHSGVYVGGGKVIHSIAEGVLQEDIIDFLRCDAFMIMRPVSGVDKAIERAKAAIGTPYDFNFEAGDQRFYCHEFTRHCYQELNIEKKIPKLYFIKGKPTYLASSFTSSNSFKEVLKMR